MMTEKIGAGWHIGPEPTNENGGWNSRCEYVYDGQDSVDDNFYVTITVNPNEVRSFNGDEMIKQNLYVNGDLKCEGWYYKDQWLNLKEASTEMKRMCLGCATQNGGGSWNFTKLKCKNLKLYSRCLNNGEVKNNYEGTKEFHDELNNLD